MSSHEDRGPAFRQALAFVRALLRMHGNPGQVTRARQPAGHVKMRMLQRRVIEVISRPSDARGDRDIDVILPWLRKKSPLLQSLERSILIDLIRYCNCLRVTRDDVIIEQGDIGDCFYIILTGVVSVYIDGSKTGEEDKPKTPPAPAPAAPEQDGGATGDGESWPEEEPEEEPRSGQPRVKKAPDRGAYGKCVIRFESGRSFGEIALMSADSVRNASIIADEEVDLMVIHRDLYNQTLKTYQELEYADRRDFVASSPLFRNWNSRFRRLLEMSLIKEVYTMDTVLYRQGDPVNGLVFITRGRSEVLVEPGRHAQQYPQLAPFPTEHDVYELEKLRPRRKAIDQEKVTGAAKPAWFRTRRQEGYAAVERLRRRRRVTLCHVGTGEVLGDVEAVLGLGTYMQTVVCTSSSLEVFVLNARNFDRLISRKNPATLDLLRHAVCTKVKCRAPTVQGLDVPLLQHARFLLTDQVRPAPRRDEELRGGKHLPDDDELFRQLMTSYVADKASLLRPHVPGAAYYRALMRQKADIRDNIRHHQSYKRQHLGQVHRKLAHQLVPRTMVHLRQDLQRQMEAGRRSEQQALLRDLRVVEQQDAEHIYRRRFGSKYQVRERRSRQLPPLDTSGGLRDDNVDGKKRSLCSIKIPNEMTPVPPIQPSGSTSSAHVRPTQHSRTSTSHVNNIQDESAQSGDGASDAPFLPPYNLQPLPPLGEPETNWFPADRSLCDPSTPAPGPTHQLPSTIEPLPPIRMGTMIETLSNPETKKGRANTPTGRHSAGAVLDEGSTTNDLTTEPPEGSLVLWREGSDRQALATYLRDRLQLDYDSPAYRDWETSDGTLTCLERRMQRFTEDLAQGHNEGRAKKPVLVKLPRFERGDDVESQPRPGGRVVVKPRTCALRNQRGSLVNHRHESYHIVPVIREWSSMRMSKRAEQLQSERARPLGTST